MTSLTLNGSDSKSSLTNADRLARALGWFSFGLGVAELLAPGRISKALGLEGKENLIRAYGAREIAAGVGSLSVEAPLGIWSRVAGDLVDLGTLAVGLRNGDGTQRRNAAIASVAVAGITLLDLAVASTLTVQRRRAGSSIGRDYSDRSGFPRGTEASRGLARDARDKEKIGSTRSMQTEMA